MANARSGSSVIQFDEHQQEKAELDFQDFGHGDIATLETSDYTNNFPSGSDIDSENAGLLSDEKKPASFWEFSYYQSFFDVDTDQVIQRIMWSMLPMRGRATYLDRVIRPVPDLYGPFWISTTLIFSTAISANIAEYFMTEGQDKRIWHYDFRKVSFAATAIYSYAFLLPLALWCLMWYRKSSTRYTLLEILCVYGYSLFIYIPISILWLIQVSWLQWMLVIIGAALSGLVLAHTFWPTVQDENKKVAVIALCLILLFHALLAVGFVACFFRPPHSTKSLPASVVTPVSIDSISPIEAADKLQKKVSREADIKNLSQAVDENFPNNAEKSVDENPPFRRETNDLSATDNARSSAIASTKQSEVPRQTDISNNTLNSKSQIKKLFSQESLPESPDKLNSKITLSSSRDLNSNSLKSHI